MKEQMKYCLFLLLILCGCHKVDDPLSPEELTKIDPLTGSYIYPVERSEHKLFEMGWDRYYDTCIIPVRILNHLTDQGLVESCLNYPPFFNLFYFDNYQDGFDRIVSESNVFHELFERKNIASILISKYESSEVDSFVVSNYSQKGIYTLQYLEIILSQNQIISKISIQQKNKLMSEVIRKYDYRKTILKEEPFSSVISSLILGRNLKTLNYNSFKIALSQNQNLENFLAKGAYYDTTSVSKIIYYTRAYLQKN